MKKTLSAWQIAGFVFTSVSGVLLHFLYDWSGQSVIAATFSAVNESIWEHLKLLFFPMFLFALVENRKAGKNYPGFWCVKLTGVVFGLILIPVLYYTINGVFGGTPDWINIAIFFAVTAAVYLLETRLFLKSTIPCKNSDGALNVLYITAALFLVFTFFPPHIPFFQDPITKTYGAIR